MAARSRRTDLAIESRRDGTVGLLHLAGEVRAELVSRLHDAAEALRAEGAHDLLVDLGGVTFVDSASIGEMVRLDTETRAVGGKAVWSAVPRIALRVLQVTGLDTRLYLAADEAGARTRLAGPA